MKQGKSLTEGQTAILSRLYNEQSLAVDKLPYTAIFDKLVQDFNALCPGVDATHHDLYTILIRLRKSSKLLRKSRSSKVESDRPRRKRGVGGEKVESPYI